jgi:hypothetical protein
MGFDLVDDPIGRGHDHKDHAPTDLQACFWCHSGGGVRSLNSRASLLKPSRRQQEPQNVEYGPIYWGDSAALAWKQNRYDWGLLNGYWKEISQTR